MMTDIQNGNSGKEFKEREACIKVKITHDSYLAEKIGSTICFDLLDLSETTYNRERNDKFTDIQNLIEHDLKIPVGLQRFWVFFPRKNNTYRPSKLLSQDKLELTLAELDQYVKGDGTVDLYLETEYGLYLLSCWFLPSLFLLLIEPRFSPRFMIPFFIQSLQPVQPLAKSDEDVMLFFKFYDAKRCTFKYIGRLTVKLSNKPVDILSRLREMAQVQEEDSLALFEEVCYHPKLICQAIDTNTTFANCKLRDGDILWLEKCELAVKDSRLMRNVPEFLEYMLRKSMSAELYTDIICKYKFFKSSKVVPMESNATLASLRHELDISTDDHEWTVERLMGSSSYEPVLFEASTTQLNENRHQAVFSRGYAQFEEKMFNKSISDSEISPRTVSSSPRWLYVLTFHTRIHATCAIHGTRMHSYCCECMVTACDSCLHHDHVGHDKLRIYKVNGRFAVEVAAFRRRFKKTDPLSENNVLIVEHNGKEMMYLHPSESTAPSKEHVHWHSYCQYCSRKITQRSPFCSLLCKASGVFRANVWKRRTVATCLFLDP
ncbi:unnamed protein product [Urochloa decumbens]|uniref:Ubiquitin carboxyl-terminal hydrolase 7 ICP0-binding domain-containing protein n=1 Tax=Urochloa decumbens TaxID=240449 RepID=A0ABC9CAV1_9POAL